ncbi:MAG: T9SS type A sorting domain-containing protein [Ignavibacteriales bacterium]|nr:T9SS type A sorting domain-containing protein [Ignavibacteriales bacterium]MCF8316829.1 T9SS type A sorting domain-containing protein [Ignavibacteriales bacterium]MCF8438405.1 T9SS type A sorting domain-containing protein [Ignavibacteriales bacterium]
MKIKLIIAIFILLITHVMAQSIEIGSAAEINVSAGADICAGSHGNITGNLTGSGTQCDGTLPVELTSFWAEISEKDVVLNWQTATEVNNYGFEIERISPQPLSWQGEGQGRSWVKIGFVEGHGNSNSPKNYFFIDNSITEGNYSYRLKQIDTDGKFEYSEIVAVEIGNPSTDGPTDFELFQNYPNPFNPNTSIDYSLPVDEYVSLKVYDILGNQVAELVNEKKAAGKYKINFNASYLSSGLCIYKIQAGSFSKVRKMMLLK